MLRAHNQNVADGRQVAFYGVDTSFNEVGRSTVLDFLVRHAPERVAAAQACFTAVAELESRWPFLPESDTGALAQAYAQLRDLDRFFEDNVTLLTDRSSAAELADIRQLLTTMVQWSEPGADWNRDLMGHNLLAIMDRERPDLKVIVCQANAHIGRAFRFGPNPTLGDILTARFGTGYLAIGFEFGQGSYLTRTVSDDGRPADLTPTIMNTPPPGSLPWQLAFSDLDAYVLDLRGAPSDPVITSWLHEPQLEHGGMWLYIDPSTAYHDATIASHYDALAFVRDITPSHPTANALRRAEARTGL